MVTNELHSIEPGAINPHTHSLGSIALGTLCFVGEDEWCMCVVPGTRHDGQLNRVMIGGDLRRVHFVVPVSPATHSGELGPTVWCMVSGLGIVQMGTGAHVRTLAAVTSSS
jgi:hypothetical protein